jgi:hypothetical protein
MDRLFSPVHQQAQAQQSNIAQLRQAFDQQAGPSRTYEGIGGQNTLNSAIQGTGNLDQARGLVGASYSGPTGLDANSFGTDQEAINRLFGQSQAYGTAPGLMGYIQQAAPELTPGQARQEAGSLRSSQDFTSQLPGLQQETQGLQDYANQQNTQATDFAKQRAGEETNIANQSRDFLTGQRESINQDLLAKIAAGKQRQADVNAAWNDVQNNGNFPSANISPDIGGLSNTETQMKAGQAQQKWDEIMGKYPDLKDFPTLQLAVTGHGFQNYQVPPEFKKQFIAANGSAAFEKMASAAEKRQRELDAYFSEKGQTGSSAKAGGEFAAYKPLYFGGDQNLNDTQVPTWQDPNKAAYLSIDMGMDPNRNNVSTEDQQKVYNNIENLLGEADRLEQGGSPYKAASILVNVQQFLTDEKASIGQWGSELTSRGKAWKKMVDKARHDYTKQTGGLAGSIIRLGSWAAPALNSFDIIPMVGGMAKGLAPGAPHEVRPIKPATYSTNPGV